ncbi:MAG TPA: DUF1579 family protein [Chthonomonadaceae bacterium]|nr:DUF1579 family protein [Chthonomonadaceae bacterium]
MRISLELERLAGTWQGKNLLWLSEQPIESVTTATVRMAAGGTCLCIEYVWSYEGEAPEGMLLIGSQGAGAVQGIWRDSWHSSAEFLISDGKAEGPGDVQILGHYSAPTGPDWGWRTHLRTDGEDRFEITMVNISPDGEETQAVRMEFGRTVGSD